MRSYNLDLPALRSILAVVDNGGITKAANRLNLTQSAVSMQIKRLEESLQFSIFQRKGHNLIPTAEGERLVKEARDFVQMNDVIWERLSVKNFDGLVRMGLPNDIVFPKFSNFLASFKEAYPKVELEVSVRDTKYLLEAFRNGQLDIILTTEMNEPKEGKIVDLLPLYWQAAIDSQIWKRTPVPFAICRHCIFREVAEQAFNHAQVIWRYAALSSNDDEIALLVRSNQAITIGVADPYNRLSALIDHQGALPKLPATYVVRYENGRAEPGLLHAIDDYLFRAFRAED